MKRSAVSACRHPSSVTEWHAINPCVDCWDWTKKFTNFAVIHALKSHRRIDRQHRVQHRDRVHEQNLCPEAVQLNSSIVIILELDYRLNDLVISECLWFRFSEHLQLDISIVDCSELAVVTRYRTAGVGKRRRSPSLYHPRQCGIVIKPCLSCLDYTVVCFITHWLQSKTVKTVAVQAKCGLNIQRAPVCRAAKKVPRGRCGYKLSASVAQRPPQAVGKVKCIVII